VEAKPQLTRSASWSVGTKHRVGWSPTQSSRSKKWRCSRGVAPIPKQINRLRPIWGGRRIRAGQSGGEENRVFGAWGIC